MLSILRHPKQKLTYMILAATVPTVIIAVLLELLLDDTALSSLLGYGFMLTGLLLYTMEVLPRERCRKKIADMSVKDAVLIGSIQGIGTLPGVSRSGSTIAGGHFFRHRPKDACALFLFNEYSRHFRCLLLGRLKAVNAPR